jgi:HD-GYP domain-containing protein (c-di-GMP phosphodiesterase class II)
VAEEILSHHERWDGSGYPRGLAGEEIPLLARITAIADAFEVMSNGRPYKAAMTTSDILAEFKNCAGSHFDPALVKTFIEIVYSE